MIRVMAQGTFDILHPGHLHYLRESKELGDELYVVIGRDSRTSERTDIFMHEEGRRQIADVLADVDEAIRGSEGSIFGTVPRVDPDTITLGHDQEFDPDELEATLAEHGHADIRFNESGPSNRSRTCFSSRQHNNGKAQANPIWASGSPHVRSRRPDR